MSVSLPQKVINVVITDAMLNGNVLGPLIDLGIRIITTRPEHDL